MNQPNLSRYLLIFMEKAAYYKFPTFGEIDLGCSFHAQDNGTYLDA
jgi:hypothetical protein